MQPRPKPRTEAVIRALTAEIEAVRSRNTGADLPSIRELARRFGASASTVQSALRVMAHAGSIGVRQGRRARILTQGDTARISAPHSQLHATIKEGILEGKYRVGARLPKFQHLQTTHHSSSNTVSAAMRTLSDEGLIHKAGKSWIVGAAPSDSSGAAARQGIVAGSRKPVILVIANNFATWYFLRFGNIHLPRFLLEFEHELRNSSVDIMPVFTVRIPGDRRVVSGTAAIEGLIKELGPRYLGSLFVGTPGSFASTLHDCIKLIGRFGRPIVFFDADCTGEGIDNRSFPKLRQFYRCYWNDARATAIAVEALADLGHRAIGMPSYPSQYSFWQGRRVDLAMAAARSYCPSMVIDSSALTEDFWVEKGQWWDIPSIAERIRTLQKAVEPRRSTPKRQVREDLFAFTPSMARLLREKGVTALLAMNDDIAREYVCWLDEAGIDVPREVSVLSFDNQEISRAFNIASIDFGLEGLAYQAAHLLLGDIPVKTDDRWGNLGSRPVLFPRGTLGGRTAASH